MSYKPDSAVATQSQAGFQSATDKKTFDLNWSTTIWNAKFFGAVGTVTSTTGSISSSSPTLTVASGQGVHFPVGSYLTVKGAGTDTGLLSNMLSAQVTAVNGDVLTLSKNASSTVSGAAVQTDDLPAFNAALAAMGPAPSPNPPGFNTAAWIGGVLYAPAGTYRWSQHFKVYRSIHLKGSHGWQFAPATHIQVDPGCGGVLFVDTVSDSNGGYSGESIVSDIFLDGQLDFEGLNSSTMRWQPSTAYTVGQVVVSNLLLDWGWAWLCTTAGTSGSTEPSWPQAAPTVPLGPSGITVTDGGVTWTAIQAHGITYTTQTHCQDCWVKGFPGNGHSCFSYSGSLSDQWRISRGRSSNNGGCGIHARGGDSNVGVAIGTLCDSNWGFGFKDDSFLGCSWYGLQTGENAYGAYYMNVGSAIGIYAEGTQPPGYVGSAAFTIQGVANAALFTNLYVKTWSAGLSVSQGVDFWHGDWVAPTVDNGYWYKCIQSGTTGGSEPTWPKTMAWNHAGSGWDVVVTDGGAKYVPYSISKVSNGITDYGAGQCSPRTFLNQTLAKQMSFNAVQSGFAFGWGCPTDSLGYNVAYDSVGKRWYFQTSSGHIAFILTDDGSALGPGNLSLLTGYYIGPDQIHITEGQFTTSAPTGGASGDIAWNGTPNSGYPDAWRYNGSTWVPCKFQNTPTFAGFGGTVGSPLALDAHRDRSCWDNQGATAEQAFTLPTVAAGSGYKFIFSVVNSFGVRVFAPSGQKIQLGASQSSSSGYVDSTTVGSVIVLESIGSSGSNPVWMATSIVGTWTAA